MLKCSAACRFHRIFAARNLKIRLPQIVVSVIQIDGFTYTGLQDNSAALLQTDLFSLVKNDGLHFILLSLRQGSFFFRSAKFANRRDKLRGRNWLSKNQQH